MRMANGKWQMANSSRGFTLIELLVVVAIIGVLASLLMVNFIGIRQRGRDAQRKSDLKQIQSSLEFYRTDTGSYPSTFPCGSSFKSSDGTVTYMNKVPCDPLQSGEFQYQYSGSGTAYCVRACLENINDSQRDTLNNGAISGCSFTTSCVVGWSHTVQNP